MEQQPARSRTQAERLREYFQQLPLKTLSLLTEQLEKAVVGGDDAAVAELALAELRKLIRAQPASEGPRIDDLQRSVFVVLEPFLVDGDIARPGQIKRSSLQPVWTWLANTALPDALETLRKDLADCEVSGRSPETGRAVRGFQQAAAAAIASVLGPSPATDRKRGLARIGAPGVLEDLPSIQTVLAQHDVLETLRGRLPRIISAFGDSQINAIRSHIGQLPSLQNPVLLPFAISLIMQRMTSPWQITRLAIAIAGSDEEARVAATPLGVAVTMVLQDLAVLIDELRQETKRGHFDRAAQHLKSLHDGVRDLRTELDFRVDSAWGRQLMAIRAEISDALTSEIESVPGRVRRLLRQRSEKDIQAGVRLDIDEADETVALVNFVAICRNYASELAINEVSLRALSDLQHYVESTTESLVESLRSGDAKVRAFRQRQAEMAIRFCEVLFGREYAALMSKAAEVALSDERKSSRAG